MTTKIELRDPDGCVVSEVTGAKRIIIRSGFGAMKAKCFVDLHQRDRALPISHEYQCRVLIDDRLKFRGQVVSVRRDTGRDELSFYAVREPELELTEGVAKTYENLSPTEILTDVMENLDSSPLVYTDSYPLSYPIDRLRFINYDLFHAIDLLAKLAGNYLWDVGWDWVIRFRPHTIEPDHVLHFDRRRLAVKVWKTTERVKNYFEVFGGVVVENQFFRFFYDENSLAKYGARRESIFVRPIVSDGAFLYLRDAVLEQLPVPAYEKYIDLYEEDVSIGFGDTLRLLNTVIHEFDEEHLYRVKLEELVVDANGQVRPRYYLADRWESASRFLRYIDHDSGEPVGDYVARRIGSFQLDVSALDSQAHLD